MPIVSGNIGGKKVKIIGMPSEIPNLRGRKLNVRQKKQVKRMIHSEQEKKFLVTTFPNATTGTQNAPFAVDDSGTGLLDLCLIPQGDSDTTRDGDRVKFLSYQFTMHWDIPNLPTDPVNGFLCRTVILQWKPSSTPSLTSIFLTDPTHSGNVITIYSQYNHDFRQDYKILYDKLFHMNGSGLNFIPSDSNADSYEVANPITSNSQKIVAHRKFLKSRRITKNLQFNAGSTAGTNHLYLFAITDTAAAVGIANKCGFWYSGQLFYSDS